MAGRPSKLTEKQWLEIADRLTNGESARALSREFGVSESAIRARLSAHVGKIKAVANQILATEAALKELPISARISAHSLADKLREISGHMASAASYSAATSHRLAGMAHAKVQEVDDGAPLDNESMDALKIVGGLTRMANEAAEIPLGLIKANKELMADAEREAEKQAPLIKMTNAEFQAIARNIAQEI